VLLEHLAAILFFAGPLFYLGLWLALAPAGVARVLASLLQRLGCAGVSRQVRAGVRCAGIVLALIAIAI
jgi:hypothetical protein